MSKNWGDKLAKICEKNSLEIGEFCKAIKISLFNDAIQNTRVKTGRAKGNWQTQDGSKPSGTIERLDPNGSAAMAEAAKNSSADGKTYFINNLPYAGVLEELDGMVGKSVARMDQIVRKAAK